ncbi:hypothetical protein QAD02_007897 [Eretmocerus hayati]|uniref:Uncharacterized protein n=1 Tax=Eretmocerus hayati TaxID=131215 RepID=A0ACC2N4Y0_9HYME|nr:hypothetical protein QAD02_007897 [Eretmocerus hayati]
MSRRFHRTLTLLARVQIFQGSDLMMTEGPWRLIESRQVRLKIECAAAKECAPNPLIAKRIIEFINTIDSVEGAASDTKEFEQEEENDDNENDAMVDESVENDSVEAETVKNESVYWRKPARPQQQRLYAVKPTTALGAPPVDEERQRLESPLQVQIPVGADLINT